MIQLNELIKIYKNTFSLKNGYKRIIKLPNIVRTLVIIAGLMGAAIIVCSIFFTKYIFISMVIYIVYCVITSRIIQSEIKRKYNDVHYLGKQAKAEFLDKASEVLKLNLNEEKELNAVVEYLSFHWQKEEKQGAFLSFFKPGMSWFAFILPVLISFFIDKINPDTMYLLILFSLYILAFIVIFQAVFIEINNNSKPNIIKSILEILHEQKIVNLRRSLAIDKIEESLFNRNFSKTSYETLIEAGYKNMIEQNVPHYISALNSISGDIDESTIQVVINDCNQASGIIINEK